MELHLGARYLQKIGCAAFLTGSRSHAGRTESRARRMPCVVGPLSKSPVATVEADALSVAHEVAVQAAPAWTVAPAGHCASTGPSGGWRRRQVDLRMSRCSLAVEAHEPRALCIRRTEPPLGLAYLLQSASGARGDLRRHLRGCNRGDVARCDQRGAFGRGFSQWVTSRRVFPGRMAWRFPCCWRRRCLHCQCAVSR